MNKESVNAGTKNATDAISDESGIAPTKTSSRYAKTYITRPKPWSPLANKAYRNLWMSWFLANICIWMCDVTAAWLMLDLAQKDFFVALVQTATTLPIVLMSLPCGAIADRVSRRKWFSLTLFWMLAITAMIPLFKNSGLLTASLLLLLVFLNGLGQAMRLTLFAAMVPDVVSKEDLPQALALHTMAVNSSRIIGPVVAGVLIGWLGVTSVFFTIAVFSLVAAIMALRCHYVVPEVPKTNDGFFRTIWMGLVFAGQSKQMQVTSLRAFVVCSQLFAFIALLPLLSREIGDQSVSTYTALFACLGVGAISVTMFMPIIRSNYKDQTIVNTASIMISLSVALVSITNSTWAAAPAIIVIGATWLSLITVLGLNVQLSLPGYMRARGMSIYMTVCFLGAALGAAVFGLLADMEGIRVSLISLSFVSFFSVWVLRNRRIEA